MTPTSTAVADDLRHARALVRLTDARFLDPLLGLLFPVAGDLVGAALGLYLVLIAWRRGMGKAVVARMLITLSVDVLLGLIPGVGDVADFVFRANTRNLALLEERREMGPRPSDWLVVAGAAALVTCAIALPVVLVVWLLRAL